MNEDYPNNPKPTNPGNNYYATFSLTVAKPATQKLAANESTPLLLNQNYVTINRADMNNSLARHF